MYKIGIWPNGNNNDVPTGVGQWIENWPENQTGAGSIPSQSTCPGRGPGPQLGVCGRAADQYFSHTLMFFPLLSLSLPLSLKINK